MKNDYNLLFDKKVLKIFLG